MSPKLGKIRRSSLIMLYPPGSIMDVEIGGTRISGVVCSLENWGEEDKGQSELKIYERRLQKKLDKHYFVLPPKSPDRDHHDPKYGYVHIKRFPEWLECPKCSRVAHMSQWDKVGTFDDTYFCAGCSPNSGRQRKQIVMPARFIMICESGHMDDFPWDRWISHRETCPKGKKTYTLIQEAAGLSGLVLKCNDCNEKKNMGNIYLADALAGIQCTGKKDWLDHKKDDCRRNGFSGLRVVQRLGSNICIPTIESSLDIPPYTSTLGRDLGSYWATLEDLIDHAARVNYISGSKPLSTMMRLCKKHTDGDVDLFVSKVEDLINKSEASSSLRGIRAEEYQIFASGESFNHEDFSTEEEDIPDDLKSYISKIARVTRLREVRVVTGFTRLKQLELNNMENHVQLSKNPKEWLPAIEVKGEGIYVQLNEDRIRAISENKEVIKKIHEIRERYIKEYRERRKDESANPPYDLSPKFFILHTLAHLLIRQLTLECGYATASLRERIYSDLTGEDTAMSGFLIYTSTSDTDGTLGGLENAGKSSRFRSTILSALQTAYWCSSDPICIAGDMQSPESYSHSSCHSCTLLPETSCEHYNQFLDRSLIIGHESKHPGFFDMALLGRQESSHG